MTTTINDVANVLQEMYPRAHALTRNKHDAEDLLQDTFVQAARYIHTFDGVTAGPWINTMMYRLFLNSIRSGSGKRGQPTYERRTVSIEQLPGFDIPFEPTADVEWDLERVLETIEQLSPDYKRVLEMVVDGASYEEMRGPLGVALGTVKSRIRRARDVLQERLNVVN